MTSLRSKLVAWYVFATAATVLFALGIGRWLLEEQVIRSVDLLNAVEFQEIEDRVGKHAGAIPEAEFLKTISAHARLDSPLYFFQVQRAGSGEVLFRSPNMKSEVVGWGSGPAEQRTLVLGSLGEVRASLFELGEYRVLIATSIHNVRRGLSGYYRMSFVVVGIVAVVSVFVGYWGSRVALDPIREIRQTADRIGADNLSERIPVGKGRDEIADLARLLNRMFDRLEVSFAQLLRFAADASHELKTPLSLVRLQSERLLLRGQLSEAGVEAVQQQLDALGRLNSVIEKLLFLAKSGAGVRPRMERQSSRDLILAFAEDAEVLCEEKGVRFQIQENDAVMVGINAVLIRQVLLNLVNNALHAMGEGGEIVLGSASSDGFWKVRVEDSGPGIPESQLAQVFEPFVRAQRPEEWESSSGAGLGLAICKNIIEIHGGRITAENRQPGPGLRVNFQVPLGGDETGNSADRRSNDERLPEV